MEARPKLIIRLSPFDKAIETLSFVLLIALWFFTAYAYITLPAVIPSHYSASGKVDDYGSKIILPILIIFVTIIFMVLTQLNKYPHIFNYIKPITVDNAEQQYTFATRMLRILKLSLTIIFSMIALFTYLTSTGVMKGLGIWFLPVCLILVLVPVIYMVIKLLSVK